jgi:hypothetical protein
MLPQVAGHGYQGRNTMKRWAILFFILSACFAFFTTMGRSVTPHAGVIGWAGGLTSFLIAIVLMTRR